MNRILLLFLSYGLYISQAQVLTVDNLVAAASLPSSRADNFIVQKGFYLKQVEQQKDTVVHNYEFRKKNDRTDSIQRWLSRHESTENVTMVYQTSCAGEYMIFRNELKKAGFYSHTDSDSLLSSCIFQKDDLQVRSNINQEDSITTYSFRLRKLVLPGLKNIYYAEDLLAFNSHESLAFIFGKDKVKKDIYFFTDKEFSRCSVLYPNTERQVVFIWKDEVNNCDLYYLIFGGHLTVQGALDFDKSIGQNKWVLKSRIHTGMTLDELRRYNGENFTFYSGHPVYSGMVLPGQGGKIDFKQEGIVLACLNCNDERFFQRQTMTADEAIADGRRLFILSIMLFPPEPDN